MFTTQINKMDMCHDHHDDRRDNIAFCFGVVKV